MNPNDLKSLIFKITVVGTHRPLYQEKVVPVSIAVHVQA